MDWLEREVRDAEERLREAMLASDVAALRGLMHDDLVFATPDGAIVHKEDDLAAHAAGRIRFTRLDLENPQVKVEGAVATVTVRAMLTGTFDESAFNGSYRYMRTWRKTGGQWQVIVGRASAEMAL